MGNGMRIDIGQRLEDQAEVDALQDLVEDIAPTEIAYIDGVTAGTVTASKAVVVGASKNIDTLSIADSGLKLGSGAGTAVTATAAELNLLDTATAGTAVASKALVLGSDKNIDTLAIADSGLKLGSGAGTAVTATAAELNLLDTATAGTAVASKALVLGSDKNIDTIAIADSGLKLGSGAGTAVTSTAAELNLLDTSVAGTAVASKAAVLGASKDLDTLTLSELNVLDDSLITLGTTTDTAATKITAEFDKTTTGIGQVLFGSLSAPHVLNTNPGSSVIADTMNILHSAGAGDCDDLIGKYTKVAMTGDGDADTTLVGSAPRAYVGLTGGSDNSVAAQAYGSQPWAKHEGTGAITAMSAVSAKLDVSADNFTVSTINAGHFHIEGAATVTGQFDGVMIEVYPDVTSMDSVLKLAIDSGAAVTNAIEVAGVTGVTNFLKLDSAAGFFVTAGTSSGSWGNADGVASKVLTIKVGDTTYYVPAHTANS